MPSKNYYDYSINKLDLVRLIIELNSKEKSTDVFKKIESILKSNTDIYEECNISEISYASQPVATMKAEFQGHSQADDSVTQQTIYHDKTSGFIISFDVMKGLSELSIAENIKSENLTQEDLSADFSAMTVKYESEANTNSLENDEVYDGLAMLFGDMAV